MRDSFFNAPAPKTHILKDIIQLITDILILANDFLQLPILNVFIGFLSNLFNEDKKQTNENKINLI